MSALAVLTFLESIQARQTHSVPDRSNEKYPVVQFERTRNILAGQVYCTCELGYGYFMPDGSCVVCTACGKEIQLDNRHLHPELAVTQSTWQIGDRQLESRPEWFDDTIKGSLNNAGFGSSGAM
jgi:hypothetical protein